MLNFVLIDLFHHQQHLFVDDVPSNQFFYMFNKSLDIEIKYSFEFIYFHRKKIFEKIVDVLKGIETPTMHDLGLEFLRVYNGKFNYREGHTVSNFFS